MHRCQLFCHNQGIYLNEYGSSCQIETSPLICSANHWTGFCIIGTSVMKDSRCSLSTYTTLRVCSHMLSSIIYFLLLFFFYLDFVSRIFTIHRTACEGGGYLLIYHFHPLYRHFDIIWVIAAESSPLRIAGSQNRTWDLWYMLFRTRSFYTYTGSCCC